MRQQQFQYRLNLKYPTQFNIILINLKTRTKQRMLNKAPIYIYINPSTPKITELQKPYDQIHHNLNLIKYEVNKLKIAPAPIECKASKQSQANLYNLIRRQKKQLKMYLMYNIRQYDIKRLKYEVKKLKTAPL